MYNVWLGKVKETPLEDPIKVEAGVLTEAETQQEKTCEKDAGMWAWQVGNPNPSR